MADFFEPILMYAPQVDEPSVPIKIPPPKGGGGGGPPKKVFAVFKGGQHAGAPANPFVYTDAPIGSQQDSNRLVVVLFTHQRSIATPRTVSGITIAGNAATVHQSAANGNGSEGVGVAIASLVVSSGETATISCTLSGDVQSAGILVYTIDLKGRPATPFHSGSNAPNGSNPSVALNIPGGGTVIAGACMENEASGFTWTGLNTESVDETQGTTSRIGSALQNGMSQQTGRTISVTRGGGQAAMALASWG